MRLGGQKETAAQDVALPKCIGSVQRRDPCDWVPVTRDFRWPDLHGASSGSLPGDGSDSLRWVGRGHQLVKRRRAMETAMELLSRVIN